MAAPFNPPMKNEEFIFTVALVNFSAPGEYKVTPTLAAGDFKVDIDGAGFGNLGTLPTVTPAGGRAVKVTLAAGEMNGDVITFQAVDQTSPKEWCDRIICILTQQ